MFIHRITTVAIAAVATALLAVGCESTTEPPVAETAPAIEPEPVGPAVEPAELGETDRVHICKNVLLASQPAEGDFDLLADKGYRSVLNLRSEPEMTQLDFDQAELLAERDIRYHHIGFRGHHELTDDVFDQVRAVLNDETNHPVLVHCASANRVGAVWLAHRVLDDGLDYETALAEAATVGLRSDALESRARDYIETQRNEPGD